MKALLAPFVGIVMHVVDGDSMVVSTPAWHGTPFEQMEIRVLSIDSPESRLPPAKCPAEVQKGLAAKAFAKGLAKPGDTITFTLQGKDKYFRLLGSITLPDGRDWAATMIAAGQARPYTGKGAKSNWCK